MAAVRLLKLEPASADLSEIGEEEVTAIALIERTSAGTGSLWDDAFTTNIYIGGGSVVAGQVTFGGPLVTHTLNGNIAIDQTSISRTGDLRIGASSVVRQLSLTALGSTIPVNDAVNPTFNSDFVAGSFVGTINELLTKPATALENYYTNGNAGTLQGGTLVYITTAGTIDAADADADDELSVVIGALQLATNSGASGPVATSGRRRVLFAAGEGAGPHDGEEVYLATTAGLGTLTAPSGSGNVVLFVGYVADDTNYDNGAGGTMEVELIRRQKRVIP